jgi:putative membrane protein
MRDDDEIARRQVDRWRLAGDAHPAVAADRHVEAGDPGVGRHRDAPRRREVRDVAYTAGLIDIRYAHLALALSRNAEARKFAETMIRDHSAVNDQALALALVKKRNITPKDNDVSKDLLAKSEALIAEMRKLDAVAFYRKYAANELSYHQLVNGAVEKIFIPNAKNSELKALLQSALQVFKVHESSR